MESNAFFRQATLRICCNLEIEEALHTMTRQNITLIGSGRTDAGVHALRQCAHVRMPRRFDTDDLRSALNGNLPRDIVVRDVRPVPAHFHARFSARGKRYAYRFTVGRLRPVFATDLFHWVRRPLDLAI